MQGKWRIFEGLECQKIQWSQYFTATTQQNQQKLAIVEQQMQEILRKHRLTWKHMLGTAVIKGNHLIILTVENQRNPLISPNQIIRKHDTQEAELIFIGADSTP